MSAATAPGARVLIRIVRSPQKARGELLALYIESRSPTDPNVVVYSITRDEWRVENHRETMWRTRRADPHQTAEAREALANIGEHVTILKGAFRAVTPADQPPADPDHQHEKHRR